MVAVIIAIILGAGLLVWIWKVPVSGFITALRKSGSSTFEAWLFLILILAGILLVGWMIYEVV